MTTIELRMSTDRIARTARRLVLLGIPITAGIAMTVLFALRELPSSHGMLALRYVSVAVIVGAIVLIFWRLFRQIQGVLVTLQDETLVGDRLGTITTIHRSEIEQVVESPHGLAIVAHAPARRIDVANHLVGFEDFRSVVASWRPSEPPGTVTEQLSREPTFLVIPIWMALRFGVPRLDDPTLSLIALAAIVAILVPAIVWYRGNRGRVQHASLYFWMSIGLLGEAAFALWDQLSH